MDNNITAHRGGQTRQFTPKQWGVMGIGKCGWSAVPEVPREVAKVFFKPVEGAPETGFLRFSESKPDKAMYMPPGAEKSKGVLDFAPPIKTRKKRRK